MAVRVGATVLRGLSPMLAGDLLRSSLVGLEALFERVGIDLWRGAASRLLDVHDPDAMAAGYQRISRAAHRARSMT